MTVQGCWSWKVIYICNLTDSAILGDYKISRLNHYFGRFLKLILWNMKTIVPLNFAIANMHTCNKIWAVIYKLRPTKSPPSDPAFYIKELLDWSSSPVTLTCVYRYVIVHTLTLPSGW